MDFVEWVGGQGQDQKTLKIFRDLNHAAHKSELRIELRQKQIF